MELATVKYWFGSGTANNISLISGFNDEWFIDIEIPSNSIETLHYVFHTKDSAGNWGTSPLISKEVEEEIPLSVDEVLKERPEPLTLEQKKALLMKRFESRLDDLIEWHESTPESTPEQFDQALSYLQAQLDSEISSVLLGGGDDKGESKENG